MKRRTDYEEVLHAILLMLVGIFFFVMIFCLPGCVSAPIAPNLKWPEPKECPKVEMPSCPKLSLPAIPQKVYLKIDGNKVEADAGGELLLRAYVDARRTLKP